MRQLGFSSTNDRGYSPLFKKLGFLTDDGTPTAYYDALRDQNTCKGILAERIRELYSEIFAINTEIHNASDDDIKGAIARITGKDLSDAQRIAATFKALVAQADFYKKKAPPEKEEKTNTTSPNGIMVGPLTSSNGNGESAHKPDFHYNIQIHLPATTDISVYNAIFKSIKEHLL